MLKTLGSLYAGLSARRRQLVIPLALALAMPGITLAADTVALTSAK